MSWMSPSYVLQTEFDELWTPLSRRYSLWLYREVEWDTSARDGNPVLFIPGNAGSSRQARSIASSAARQFYSQPGVQNPEFSGLRPVDVFTVEFNEDLSALHGPTLQTQAQYVSEASHFILSTYRPHKRRVTLIGHSMGGIVAQLALASTSHNGWNASDISAIITMSTPHALAPARLDPTIDTIYRDVSHWEHAATLYHPPTLAICGGSTDSQIPSETCALPDLQLESSSGHYRRSVHTSSSPGIWTGVGHREMVWCHQVRWRVARAVLEIGDGGAEPRVSASASLDRWFPSPSPSANTLPVSYSNIPVPPLRTGGAPHTIITSSVLRVPKHTVGRHTYFLPIPVPNPPSSSSIINTDARTFSLLTRGSLVLPPLPAGKTPYHSENLPKISLYTCESSSESEDDGRLPETCEALDRDATSESLLMPLPNAGKAFPGEEGADEGNGALYYSATVRVEPQGAGVRKEWLAVHVDAESSGDGWLVAGFDQEREFEASTSLGSFGLMFGTLITHFDQHPFIPFKETLSLPMSTSSLLVYKTSIERRGSCEESLLSVPVIHFTPPHTLSSSSSLESHFFAPLHPLETIYISGHTSGPFLHASTNISSTSTIDIYTSGSCGVKTVYITIDWRASFGRAAARYWTAIPIYMIGVVALAISAAFRDGEVVNNDFANPTIALLRGTTKHIPACAGILTLLAALPLPRYALLGNGGEVVFAGLPALCLMFALGVVWAVWWVLGGVVRGLTIVRGFLGSRTVTSNAPKVDDSSRWTTSTVAMGLFTVMLSTFLYPVQVVYLIVLVRQFWRCSESDTSRPAKVRLSDPPGILDQRHQGWRMSPVPGHRSRSVSPLRAQRLHVLLLLTVLFPLLGPVLAVWARTVATAGILAPFRGDHNIFKLLFILCLAEGTEYELPRARNRLHSQMIWVPLSVLAAFCFILGLRFSYGVVMMANAVAACICVTVLLSRRS